MKPIVLAATIVTTMGATGPCDIYSHAGTPCVAAHSMARALYSSYDGPLYSVYRSSDKQTKDIGVLSAGGFADASAQDEFCAGSRTSCTVVRIYDQSPKGNHLNIAGGGSGGKSPDKGVNAERAPLSIGGHKVYAAAFEGGMGYRNNNPQGTAVGDEPETMYMVLDGKVYNSKCCFDYGNAERDSKDDGPGTMEAIYFGTESGGALGRHWHGAGKGPWIMADMENGLVPGATMIDNNNPTIQGVQLLTAMVKGNADKFALKRGDAQSGDLKTIYEGARPALYRNMKKQGAIILGIGGDNSKGGVGVFFEGVMTSGYSTDAADQAVHANIVAAGYALPKYELVV